MDNRSKSKTKRNSDKPKQSKKKKSDGPTCSTFLSQLTRRFMSKKKQREASCNIVRSIVNSLTNTLPIQFTVTPQKKKSPASIEPLQTLATEPVYADSVEMPHRKRSASIAPVISTDTTQNNKHFQPKMPIMKSEELQPLAMKPKVATKDIAVCATSERDVAAEIAKHVATLRKISLIAEEFNKKTARNLKEIVDSVQQDLIKKLEEVKAEQHARVCEKQIKIT